MCTAKTWRTKTKKKLQELDFNTQAKLSTQICSNIENHPLFQRAKHIAAFYPTKNEVNILPLLQRAINRQQKVYLPKVKHDFSMEMHLISNFSTDLSPGFMNILEPKQNSNTSLNFDLILVPGVVFNEFGERIGKGGGYYDRFLARINKGISLAVAFQVQFCSERLPQNKTDIEMQYIATENGIFAPKKGG